MPPPPDLLRVRQEVAAAAVRSPSGLEVHLPSSTAGQRRKQGLAQHREGTAPAGAPSFSERYWGACISEAPMFTVLVPGVQSWGGEPITWFLKVRPTACTSTLVSHLGCTLPSRPSRTALWILNVLGSGLSPRLRAYCAEGIDSPLSWAEAQKNIPGVEFVGATTPLVGAVRALSH